MIAMQHRFQRIGSGQKSYNKYYAPTLRQLGEGKFRPGTGKNIPWERCCIRLSGARCPYPGAAEWFVATWRHRKNWARVPMGQSGSLSAHHW